MMMVIVAVSVLIAISGIGFYLFNDNVSGIIPFIIGVTMGSGVNIIKVIWLKKSVTRAITLEAYAATAHMKSQYFLRLMLTLFVLVAGGFLHQAGHVNLIGLAIALIISMPIASYSMQYFVPKDEHTEALTSSLTTKSSSTQDAIDEINALAKKDIEKK